MHDSFYRAFEEKHRGSRESVKSRQRVYLPFIEPLRSIYSDTRAIDLGCGRGEWLELLKESGFDAQGVDLDEGMLAACRERGLNVETADVLVALKALPDESQLVVSGFHIAEHLPFPDLQTLVQEALRVLKPAGLLILETPNPENIVVGSCNFYLDPTHQRPIPPQLLSFLPEHYGFARSKLLRLQESVDLSEGRAPSLKDVLGGVSPDYAIVAQKAADESTLAAMRSAFEPEHGISLEALADRYDRQAEMVAHAAEFKAAAQEQRAIAAEQAAQHWHEHVLALHASKSWQITRPLRALRRLAAGDFSVLHRSTAAAKHMAKQILRPAVASGIAYARKRPVLRNRLKTLLIPFPWLYQRLRRVAANTPAASMGHGTALPTSPELHALTPRARQIYADLKAAIERYQKENG